MSEPYEDMCAARHHFLLAWTAWLRTRPSEAQIALETQALPAMLRLVVEQMGAKS